MTIAETIQKFESISQDIVESLRLGDGLIGKSFIECQQLLESIVRQLEGETQLPKNLAYAIQVLRDNFIGALSSYSGTEREAIARANSYLDEAIERLLLG